MGTKVRPVLVFMGHRNASESICNISVSSAFIFAGPAVSLSRFIISITFCKMSLISVSAVTSRRACSGYLAKWNQECSIHAPKIGGFHALMALGKRQLRL